MYPIQRGQILLDGVPIERLDLTHLRSRMAVVLQDVFLFSGDIMDNIKLQSDIPEEKAIESARFVNADFVEALPKTSTDKVDYQELRQTSASERVIE